MEKIQSIFAENKKAILWGAALGAIFFVISFLSFRVYESTVSIMITAKSEAASFQMDEVVANISKLPETLAFYDRLLANNLDVRDVVYSKNQTQRRDFWNEIVSVKSDKKSSIIEISIESFDENVATQLANKTARTLFDTANLYYNVKTDVDLRLIDGPITKKVSISQWPWLLLASLALGFAIGFVISQTSSLLLEALSKQFEKIKEWKQMRMQESSPTKKIETEEPMEEEKTSGSDERAVEAVAAEPKKDAEKSLEDKELETLNKIIQQDIYPNFPEMPKHASAPDNLPIADSSFYMADEKMNEEKVAEANEETSEAEQLHREPTPEELKKRLNELLKGKI
ncbi:MAG: hypothetical protein ACD_56C00057G0007 [uncultured bacterium]|nr:MAG: hypothetical protein ACD_56C00057G0007 [uncultured bacterium]